MRLTADFGREHPLTRARLDLGPSELLNARWKRIILGMSLQRNVTNDRRGACCRNRDSRRNEVRQNAQH